MVEKSGKSVHDSIEDDMAHALCPLHHDPSQPPHRRHAHAPPQRPVEAIHPPHNERMHVEDDETKNRTPRANEGHDEAESDDNTTILHANRKSRLGHHGQTHEVLVLALGGLEPPH